MSGTTNTAAGTTVAGATSQHTGLIGELEHLGHEIITGLKNPSTFLTQIVKSGPVQEIAAYEKTHGADQIAAIKKAGMDVYTADRAKGIDKATAVLAGIRAAFECGLAEVKSLSTFAMTLLLTEAAADLGM